MYIYIIFIFITEYIYIYCRNLTKMWEKIYYLCQEFKIVDCKYKKFQDKEMIDL